MSGIGFLFAALALLSGPAAGQDADREDPLLRPIAEQYAARWLKPQRPARLFGQSYYVGFKGLSVVLVRTRAGLILFDGGVPQSVRAIQANIRALGFDPRQIKYIFVTEPHWDHAGGVAALARDSGATVIAGAAAVDELRRGNVGADDPQASIHAPMPGVARVRGVRDGEQVRLGGVTITARATPGHTRGSTSWLWRCAKGNVARHWFSPRASIR